MQRAIEKYTLSKVKMPYFLFVSDAMYDSAKSVLSESAFTFIKLSEFCGDYDKPPDIDGLVEYLKTADVDGRHGKLAVLGLGEHLAIHGADDTVKVLSQLKDLNTGETKVVLLLRGVASQISKFTADPRFDKRRYEITDNATCDLSFTIISKSIGFSSLGGYQLLLNELENGRSGNIVINTDVNFDNSLFTTRRINNAYEGIQKILPTFKLPYTSGSDEQWAELLSDLNNSSLNDVFEKHGYGGNIEQDFYSRLSGVDYRNWLYFIALKYKVNNVQNGYLRYVLEITDKYDDFKTNILDAIKDVMHTDIQYPKFYTERKYLIEKFTEAEIANFVVNNRANVSESIYRLTDCTVPEREEIIDWVSKKGLIQKMDEIYPSLDSYMKKYVFKSTEFSDEFTEYFDEYKKQKVLNSLDSAFLDRVDELARDRSMFNRLPTRNEVLDKIDKLNAQLYWLDALGVEYLAFIEELVQKHGLSMMIKIARAELPTITSINRDFFETWDDGRKTKDGRLDEAKHKEEGGYNFDLNKLPIHLVKELDIIADVINRAATELAMRRCNRFIIASDHGASRLAVLRKKEEKYETDTKGEHSGRCCKVFYPYDLPYAVEENGYLVLADYGRFRGSRSANVEVHGGASLEEVVVPIIELTLRDGSVTVQLIEDIITVDYRTGTEINLFINTSVVDISIILNDKRYKGIKTSDNHYKIALPDITRAGEYPADVYAGDNLIGSIHIKAKGKSGNVDSDFDEMF
jgi:hypothetical protein